MVCELLCAVALIAGYALGIASAVACFRLLAGRTDRNIRPGLIHAGKPAAAPQEQSGDKLPIAEQWSNVWAYSGKPQPREGKADD